ncbi:MAG TPA: GTP cyclohydrolase MptA [Thermoplasmataceae archaeon]|nr:GTP cyclohydrolase MptA [Thermoplasmataceae archaeon]
MIDLVDVQASKPSVQIPITEVGLAGIKYPIKVNRGNREINLTAEITIFADLPAARKGADFSRNVEAINEVILNNSVTSGIEVLAASLASRVLEKLPYSNSARVEILSTLLMEKSDHSSRSAIVPYDIYGSAAVKRGEGPSMTVGVTCLTLTACPCAMETTRALISSEHPEVSAALEKIPSITHNQRNRVTVQISNLKASIVNIEDIISVVEETTGGPLFSLLKRIDEGELVYRAHKNPKFVEDVVRDVAKAVVTRLSAIPGSCILTVKSQSQESIHPHDAVAKIEAPIETLRKLMNVH